MPSYESLASATASGSSPTVSFTSISSAYTDLVLVVYGIANNYISMTFNSDPSNSGNYARAEGVGSNGSALTYAAADPVCIAGAGSATDGRLNVLNIMNYTGSGGKMWLYNQFIDGSNFISGHGLWNVGSVINRIDLTLTGGSNYTAGGVFALYGIRAS
jgi:hypothetical protein